MKRQGKIPSIRCSFEIEIGINTYSQIVSAVGFPEDLLLRWHVVLQVLPRSKLHHPTIDVLQESRVGLPQPIAQWRLRLPAERCQLRDVEQLLRRTVGPGYVERDLSRIAHDIGDHPRK